MGASLENPLQPIALLISLFVLFAKWQEKPRLRVLLGKAPFSEGEDDTTRWRFAHISVENARAPRIVRWLTYRQTAQRTRLDLSFSAEDGTVPKFSFEGRWSANPEPYQERLIDGQVQKGFDPWLVHMGRFKDITSGDTPDEVAVAVKAEGETDCYGFTNESYYGHHWRVPEYRLPVGTYRITATAISGEVRSDSQEFLLHNDGPSLSDLWLDTPKRR